MSPQDNGSTAVVDGATSTGVTKPLLIDGELVMLDKTFPSYNPATGELFGHAPDAGVDEAEAAVAAARRAFDTTTWQPTPSSVPTVWTSCTRRCRTTRKSCASC